MYAIRSYYAEITRLYSQKMLFDGLKLLYTPDANSLLSVMAEVCSTCGLPKDLCVCGEIEKEQQRIRVRLETRKYGKATTIIDRITSYNVCYTKLLRNRCFRRCQI